ncbi:MAG TPA: hypothetical protein DD738_13700 [Ruminiclostridium sp.]|nr:hypothetical protein [Ruminiclostridium sp.]
MDSFKPITLEEQPLFTNIFNAIKPVASELTFPYLFMWRRDYNLSYEVIADHLCLVSQSRVFPPYAFCPIPLDGKRNDEKLGLALKKVEACFDKRGLPLLLGRVEERRLPELRQVFGKRMEEKFLDAASDYVYEIPKLVGLSGGKLSSKRNHIKQFLRQYGEYEYVPVDESNIHECRRILEEWCDRNEEGTHEDNSERWACNELFKNWSRLPVRGALIKVAGRFEAFTVGELLNPRMAAIRIEKGNSDIHGIYTLINRDFCAHELSGLQYINREEDMGKEGLRKSKLSYNPAFMVNKFLVKVLH